MTQVAAAAGVAAGTGAAQLGLGYGLGVVVWPATPNSDDSVWLGSLGWATWIAASATVFGAVIAARLRGAQAPRLGGPWRFALAASAAVGALLTVALIAVPARSAVRADTFAAEMIAGGYAVIGIVLGLLIAYWAVVSRAVAANLIATAGYLWALAAAGIAVELTLHRESATYLTSWQFAELGTQARYGTIYWPSALLTLLAALIVGMIAAWPSVRSGDLGVGAACSGAVGPLLVAASFLALAPQLTSALGQLESAYLIAPYAVLAGLAGSALIVASGQRSAQRRAARIHRPSPPAATGKATVPAQAGAAQAGAAQAGAAQAGTPPNGTPRVSSAAQKPKQVQASADAPTAGPGSAGDADEDRATAPSDRTGRWGRMRRGGRAKPSAAAGRAEVTTSPDPTPVSNSSQASTGAATASARTSKPAARRQHPTPPPASTPAPPPPASTSAAPPLKGRPAPRAAGSASAEGGGTDSTKPKGRPKTGSRSTVAAPPPAPPIAKINPPQETAAEPGARPDARSAPAKPQPETKPDKSG